MHGSAHPFAKLAGFLASLEAFTVQDDTCNNRGKSRRKHEKKKLDERQIAHLICARLKYDLYDFFRGCFGPASFLSLV